MAFDEMKKDITNPSRETSPNRGTSLPQEAAIPSPRQPLRQWQAENNIDREAQIKLTRIAHMRYQHPDLAEITTFLRDFGMSVVKKVEGKRWFKGYGTDAYVYYAQEGEKKFLGGTFEVESFGELEKASKLPSASPIQELTEAPGGGHMVTLHDPLGFPINLLYGQEKTEGGPWPEILTTNYEVSKPRKAHFQRFTPGPAAVHKLGHYGLCVTDFKKELDWYIRTFNFAPTDFLYVDDNDNSNNNNNNNNSNENSTTTSLPNTTKKTKDVAAFLHIDIGPSYTDHHTFFMSSNPTSHVHHCSFEVHDFDTQSIGHAWLVKQAKYTPVWGVGRHILGSQIFDYWWDTSGNMVEHYADGDLVNEDTPVGWGEAGDESLAVWGPEVPKWFLD